MLASKALAICAAALAVLLGSSARERVNAQEIANAPSMASIMTWLSENFDLPATHEKPRIELVPASQMAALRYRGLFPAGRPQDASAQSPAEAQGGDLVAIYDDAQKTIYLPQSWTGGTPAETSVLVHELVHHLQNLAGLKYECPQAREAPAYAAQDRWLDRFGLSLESEFGINPMSRLVHTRCLG